MGTYINIGNAGFLSARNGEYVDKSGLIAVAPRLAVSRILKCRARWKERCGLTSGSISWRLCVIRRTCFQLRQADQDSKLPDREVSGIITITDPSRGTRTRDL